MNALYIFVFLIVTCLIVWMIVKLAPSVVSFHRDSLAPIRNLFGNPEAAKTVAKVLV